jgi:hypothetical protein
MLAGGQLLVIMSITFGLLLLGIGVFALFLGLRLLWGMPAALSQTSGVRLAARRWPAAPGTIIGAEVRVAPGLTRNHSTTRSCDTLIPFRVRSMKARR